MFNLPRIRIEIDNMKYQIIHAFTSHNDEIEKAVEAELTKAIENYPFGLEVSKLSEEVITEVIKESLSNYFKYGDGREAIDKAVSQAVNRITKSVTNE